MGRTSIQVARIFGIRIGVDASWFLVLFVFIFLLSGSFRNTLDSSDTVAYATAVASALSFFVSLILHELGHALVARRLGIEIAGIDLWFFGGIAKMKRDTESPGDEFKVAIAGPLVTLGVVGACLAAGTAAAGSWNEFWKTATLSSGAHVTPPTLLLSWLASINSMLFVFNLIPAFPLDGGRIARAIAWKLTGDRLRATRTAASLGQGFSYILIGLGIFTLAAYAGLSGLWFIALGLFLGQAARGAVAQTAFSERLEGVTVADIMDTEPVTIPAEIETERALDDYFHRYRWPWFAVVDAAGRYRGIVRRQAVDEAVHQGRGAEPVVAVIESVGEDSHIRQDASLEDVLRAPGLSRTGALMAVDAEGILRGVVTVEQVQRALQRVATRAAT